MKRIMTFMKPIVAGHETWVYNLTIFEDEPKPKKQNATSELNVILLAAHR